jgi:hypothetical protein
MKTRISGKEAARVAEDMAKPGPIRVVAASEAQEAPGALVPSPGSELDRKVPPLTLVSRTRAPLRQYQPAFPQRLQLSYDADGGFVGVRWTGHASRGVGKVGPRLAIELMPVNAIPAVFGRCREA